MKAKFITLMYHEIDNNCKTKYYVSLNNFIDHIKLFNSYKNQIKLFKDLDIISLNHPLFIITFDDGHFSNLQAAELLKNHNLFATFFIVYDFIGRKNYLSALDVKQISDWGHEIGLHGKNHESWLKKSDNLLYEELFFAKSEIEKLIDKSIIVCSAPGGKINSDKFNFLINSALGFRFIRGSVPGLNQMNTNSIVKSFPIYTYTNLSTIVNLFKLDLIEILIYKLFFYSKEFIKNLFFKK
jgi:peptidoglycan/xylan/chitin deacetylase (PgdA/CDA1 family)